MGNLAYYDGNKDLLTLLETLQNDPATRIDHIVENNANFILENYTAEDGTSYNFYIHVPDNLNNESVAVGFYLTADANLKSSGGKYIFNYLDNNESNILTIIPDWCENSVDPNKQKELNIEILNYLKEKYNFNYIKTTVNGFSKTSNIAILSQATLNEYYQNDKNTLLLFDPCWVKPSSDDVKENLKNTIALCFGLGDNSLINNGYGQVFDKLINIMNNKYVIPNDVNLISHTRRNMFGNLDGALEFSLGYRDLYDLENYTFQIFNKETNNFETITYEQVKEYIPDITPLDIMIGKYRYLCNLNEVVCNNTEVESYANDVISKIRNMSYLSNLKNDMDFSSTTQTPNIESDILFEFYAALSDTLGNLNNQINNLVAYADSIVNLEESEKQKAENLSEG